MIGQTLGHFEITTKLGEGGMGAVYLAVDQQLQRQVALKVLPSHLADDPERLERFQREAETLAALNHPNIVSIYSIEEAGGVRFLIMEHVQGQDLGHVIPAEGLDVDSFLDLAVPMAEALATAHSRGIVHRDLKPQNVMVTDEDVVKILDLGLAKILEDSDPISSESATRTASPTALGVVMGTVGYMSPEQAEGRPVGPPSDVFSLGALFYEMLSGSNPFRRDSTASSLAAILHHQPDPLRQHHRALPRDLQGILDRCLAKQPEERYPSAEGLQIDLEASRRRYRRGHTGLRAVLRRPVVAIPLLLLVLGGIALSIRLWQGATDRRWAREEALPEIERLIDISWRDSTAVYELAVEAERSIPDDPRLQELLARSSLRASVTTEPPGADVLVQGFNEPDSEWQHLGVTPLEGVRLPISILRWRFEKEGFDTVLAAESTWSISPGGDALLDPNTVTRKLDRAGGIPPGMVRVAGAATAVGPLEDFFIDRHEVTNREFKKFIDGGGYRTRDYWQHPFVENGSTLTWEAAMSRFVDQTERPGPAPWQAGSFPVGHGDFPVSGVSWYEAAAYAEFAGRMLPTVHHWGLARGEATPAILFPQLGGFAVFAPFSNFGGVGPRVVADQPGITAYGANDMAGNVREWCFNASRDGAMVRGGSWSDTTYMFASLSQLPRLDRSPQNGFRTALYPEPASVPAAAFEAVVLATPPSAVAQELVSDEVFAVFKERFDYDRVDLQARLETRREDNELWIRETVSYDAAYGDERVLAHLFLPRSASPPYQAVVYFPGSGALFQSSSEEIEAYFEFSIFLPFLIQNGRAVLFPVYQGTFERRDPGLVPIHIGDRSHRYTEFLEHLVKDFRRSVDYLATRDDIDETKIAFYGLSWGSLVGGIIPAVEDRLQASILVSGGLPVKDNGQLAEFRPEADPVNYLPRIELPTLMINGRYDMILPLESSIQPMFALLGTSPDHKELHLYDTDHIPPRNELIKETLAWLDRYLGPVN